MSQTEPNPTQASPAHSSTAPGVGGVVAGAGLIAWAIVLSAPLLGVVGVAASAVGLALVNSRLRLVCEKRQVICSLMGLTLVLLGVAIVVLAFDRASALMAALGVGITGGGLVLLGQELMLAGKKRPGWWVSAGLALAALGLGVAFMLDLHWTVGILLAVLGLGLFRAGMSPLCEDSRGDTRWWCIRAGFASTLLGISLFLVGVVAAVSILVVPGLFLLAFGLIPLSIGWLRDGVRPIGSRWAMAIGIAVGTVGLVFWPEGAPAQLPMIIGGLLAAVGASFVLRGEGFVAVVLTGFVLVWVLVDRTDEAPLDPNPTAPDRILALGDSYSSGEGSTAFFSGTNVVGDNENQCRRSSTAYPYLVASRLGMGLDFFACSGATAIQVYKEGQMGPGSPDNVVGELPQLANLGEDTSRIRVVLLSIGGNDALFGEIGIACVFPGSCAALREHWLVNVARIGSGITSAYEAIKDAVGPSTPIVAIPYPLLLTEGGCRWSALNASEHDFLSEFLTVLDDRVRRSAEQAGIYFFEPGLFAFEHAKICDGDGPDDTVMNFFNAHPTQGGLIDRVNPAHWVHGTFHPKPSGHVAIADLLTPWLENLLSEIDAGRLPPNPAPNPDATFEIRRVSSVETVLSNTLALPRRIGCPVAKVSPFATLLPLLDDTDPFALNASPDAPLCHTQLDGSWTKAEEGVVTRLEGVVTIQPNVPDEGWTQRFIYKEAGGAGTWQLRIVEFCNKKPGCPDDVGMWMNDQLLVAAQSAVRPAPFLFLGGWLLALGLRSTFDRRDEDPTAPQAERGPE